MDHFSLTFEFQQKLFASSALLIAVSHTALAAGFNPVAGVLGRAVQVDPIKPMMKPLELSAGSWKYGEPLSNFASEFNLCRYNWGWEW